MTTIENNRLIRALLRQPVDRTPVWMMRQAGRYLPEYRALRKQAPDFMSFCKSPKLACEATLQPLRRFELDAAIVFSDILTIPEAMGVSLEFKSGEGPVFANPIRTLQDVEKLHQLNVEQDLDYVMETIEQVTTALSGKLPLIGFAGSPWTVATYMVEGRSTKMFREIKTMLYQQPETLHALLQRLTEATIDYLNAQIMAGANAIMLFDTWGGVLNTEAYQQFSLQYMSKIAKNLHTVKGDQKIPVVFFTKHAGQWLEMIAAAGADGIGLDWTIDIAAAKKRVGHRVALQGNLDPFLLFAKPEKIRQQVTKILSDVGDHPGHVFNLGHGIDRDTPIENVNVMIHAVQEFSKVKLT